MSLMGQTQSSASLCLAGRVETGCNIVADSQDWLWGNFSLRFLCLLHRYFGFWKTKGVKHQSDVWYFKRIIEPEDRDSTFLKTTTVKASISVHSNCVQKSPPTLKNRDALSSVCTHRFQSANSVFILMCPTMPDGLSSSYIPHLG